MAPRLIEEGFFADATDARRLCWRISTRSTATPDNKPLAWRYGIDESVLDPRVRTSRNRQLDHSIRCCRRARGADGVEIDGFRGRHVVVTGGTGALGTAVVGALLEAGATCHVPYRSADEAEALSAPRAQAA